MTPALVLALTITATPGMLQFTSRVHDYVEVHRRAAAGIEQPLCADPEVLARQAVELAAAIREARPRAKEGDIFTIAAGEAFRARIAATIRRNGIDVAAVIGRDDDEGEAMELYVLGTLPWWPNHALNPIARELPELPVELEYRFVGRHLVLVDVAANLVVDVLRNALPLPADAPPVARRDAPALHTVCDVHPELDACWM